MTSECKSVAVVYASSDMARFAVQEVPRTELEEFTYLEDEK